jgi:hypothetical protein
MHFVEIRILIAPFVWKYHKRINFVNQSFNGHQESRTHGRNENRHSWHCKKAPENECCFSGCGRYLEISITNGEECDEAEI